MKVDAGKVVSLLVAAVFFVMAFKYAYLGLHEVAPLQGKDFAYAGISFAIGDVLAFLATKR